MKLAEVKAAITATLQANPKLSALGTIIDFSAFANIDEVKEQIDARMEQYGAAIEVGLISSRGESGGDRTQARKRTVSFMVFVAESMTKAHTPADLELVDEVIETIENITHRVFRPACIEQESAVNDAGRVLHILLFEMTLFDR